MSPGGPARYPAHMTSVPPTVPGRAPDAQPGPRLRALLVDDEAPTLSELTYLLEQDPRIGSISTAGSATEALRALDDDHVDVVFSDISMPGLDGMDLARVLARFADRPQVVFVTAYDGYAVDAFDLDATDYVMKPVRAERLAEAVRRVVERHTERAIGSAAAEQATTPAGAPGPTDRLPEGTDGATSSDDTVTALNGPGPLATPRSDEVIPVELAGVTTFVQRSQIRYAQAHGDYARLHTATDSHLVRISLNALEERWGPHGFVRIHRSTLASMAHITAVTMAHGRCTVTLEDVVLQVSRRHTRQLRDRLARLTPRS